MKVADLRRGAVHQHAIVRANSAGDELSPPALPVTSSLLAAAHARAARAVFKARELGGESYEMRFGEQLRVDELDPSSFGPSAGTWSTP